MYRPLQYVTDVPGISRKFFRLCQNRVYKNIKCHCRVQFGLHSNVITRKAEMSTAISDSVVVVCSGNL